MRNLGRALLATAAVSLLSAGLMAPASASAPAVDTAMVTENDWLYLSVTGEAPPALYALVDSLHGTQGQDELAELEEVASYSIVYADGSVAGVPFPDGTSLPELVEEGRVSPDGLPTAELAAQLDLPLTMAAPSEVAPMAVSGPSTCVGAASSATKTHRYVAGGKGYCESWTGTGIRGGLSLNAVYSWSTGSTYYGCIAYKQSSLYLQQRRAPGSSVSLSPAALVFNIGRSTSSISNCQ